MKSLWNMLNKEFTIEGAVSAFLVINIIAWTLGKSKGVLPYGRLQN